VSALLASVLTLPACVDSAVPRVDVLPPGVSTVRRACRPFLLAFRVDGSGRVKGSGFACRPCRRVCRWFRGVSTVVAVVSALSAGVSALRCRELTFAALWADPSWACRPFNRRVDSSGYETDRPPRLGVPPNACWWAAPVLRQRGPAPPLGTDRRASLWCRSPMCVSTSQRVSTFLTCESTAGGRGC
jgi:hypothetical protein